MGGSANGLAVDLCSTSLLQRDLRYAILPCQILGSCIVRSQSRSSCWVKQRGSLVYPGGGGWQSELWLPQDCLEIVCCLVTD